MPRTRQTITEESSHVHTWVYGSGDERKCSCETVEITRSEYGNRVRAWDAVYLKARDSESYVIWMEMRKALARGDKVELQRLREHNRELLDGSHPESPKGDDPRRLSYYGKLSLVN